MLAAVTFTRRAAARRARRRRRDRRCSVPLLIALLVIAGPRLLALGRRSRSRRVVRSAARSLDAAAAPGAARPASCSRARATARRRSPLQLLAWALQWLACYTVLLALGLEHEAGLAAAAAILLAVNVSAVLPATPSNVGVFQAACLVVLAAFGVGAGSGLAYGHHPAGRRGRSPRSASACRRCCARG